MRVRFSLGLAAEEISWAEEHEARSVIADAVDSRVGGIVTKKLHPYQFFTTPAWSPLNYPYYLGYI